MAETSAAVKRYVVGFLFSEDAKEVVLIRKNRPAWQDGLFNGIGGKIKQGELPPAAMKREFEEEAGVRITDWRLFCRLIYDNAHLHFYMARGDLSNVHTCTDEHISVFPVSSVPQLHAVPNLRWLIPLALDKDNLTATIYGRHDDKRDV